MADYWIICTRKSTCPNGHHITHVGTGVMPTTYTLLWTVAQARAALMKPMPDSFHTISAGGVKAWVAPYTCPCGVETLRSHADRVWTNNLDALGTCS